MLVLELYLCLLLKVGGTSSSNGCNARTHHNTHLSSELDQSRTDLLNAEHTASFHKLALAGLPEPIEVTC